MVVVEKTTVNGEEGGRRVKVLIMSWKRWMERWMNYVHYIGNTQRVTKGEVRPSREIRGSCMEINPDFHYIQVDR